MPRDTMNVVIVGHVDHGKSTLVGRLLADTGVLGEGKLEKVRNVCRQQGKVFEYAFLLDALEEEQGQGITIDSARVFFRTELRDYIIIDAPGHIEFLKNMVSGAARAEAAILLIDANEGVRENSRRHGYLLSMLGIKQVVVAVNKIDLVGYNQRVFQTICDEYTTFLKGIGVVPHHFVPISAREGDLITGPSSRLPWYQGPSILEAMDGFTKRAAKTELPLRLPVQDIYKFNERGDDRRIVAGRIEAGQFSVGDEVVFSPSFKRSKIASIEAFSAPSQDRAIAGRSVGITLTEQVYVGRGELMSTLTDAPQVSSRFRTNLFWLGKSPMRPGKRYKLKLATTETEVAIDTVHRVLDASDLATTNAKTEIGRHDVAEVTLRTRNPIAFDTVGDLETTGRFVIVDGYDIAGGGIIRESLADGAETPRLQAKIRQLGWVRGAISAAQRAERNGHLPGLVMITGAIGTGKHKLARALETKLFDSGHRAYLLDGRNVVIGVDADVAFDDIKEVVRRFGEVAYLLLDAGNLVVSTTNVIGTADHRTVATHVAPYPVVVVHLGTDKPADADLVLQPNGEIDADIATIWAALAARGRLRPDPSA